MNFLRSLVQRVPDEPMLESWWHMFRDLDAREFQRGIIAAVREHKFAGFPPIAKILEHGSQRSRDVNAQAAEAWAHVRNAIKRYGANYSVSFSDTLIHYVIETTFGSWVNLCGNTSEDITKYRQGEFMKAYINLASAQKLPVMPSHLPGIMEISSGMSKHGGYFDVVNIESGVNNNRIAPQETQVKLKRESTTGHQIGEIIKFITQPKNEAS